MKHHAIIEAAQVGHGIIPATFFCACCGDELDREDHMKGHFKPEHEEAVFNKFGPNVCFGCADDFNDDETPCPDCGHTACTCDDAYEAYVSELLAGE